MIDVIQRLTELGWLPEGWNGDDAQYLQVATDYLRFHGLLPGGDVAADVIWNLLDRSLAAVRFCSLPDRAEVRSGLRRWATPYNMIRWAHDGSTTSRLSAEAAKEGFALALSYWSEVADLKFEMSAPATANILFGIGKIDGSSGTLAWSELPGNAQTSGRVTQLYDAKEIWVQSESPQQFEIDFVRVACHEVGHALGMDHIDGGNLLAPMYSAGIRRPQEGDVEEMRKRYGPPKAPPVTPVPSDRPVTIQLTGNVTGIEIPGYRITKLS